jgi:hypothetical protein
VKKLTAVILFHYAAARITPNTAIANYLVRASHWAEFFTTHTSNTKAAHRRHSRTQTQFNFPLTFFLRYFLRASAVLLGSVQRGGKRAWHVIISKS